MSTIDDVARKAGVARVTVSRVINNSGIVSPATRERVMRIIEELQYVPNRVAGSLRSNRTRTLALMVPDITSLFWTTVARGVEDAAQDEDYSIFLCNTDENPAKQREYLQAVLRQRVDGVIIAPYDLDARNLEPLRQKNVPTVVVDRRITGWDVDHVYADSFSGAKALVRHLISLGHRNIAAISGPRKTSTALDRVAGYLAALSDAGIPIQPGLIRWGEYRESSGATLTSQIMKEGLAPTAIFAANYIIAIGVLEALGTFGLQVPQDIALVSFDELPFADLFYPFLTVIDQPPYDIGATAAQLMLSRLASGIDLAPRRVILPVHLILRYSCGRRKNDLPEGCTRLPFYPKPDSQTIPVEQATPEEHLKYTLMMESEK